jgi:hypothetical protein
LNKNPSPLEVRENSRRDAGEETKLNENDQPAKKLITFEEVQDRLLEAHRTPYFAWLNSILTLSSIELTLLVTLGIDTIKTAEYPELIRICWVCLTISVLTGVHSTATAWVLPLKAAAQISADRKKYGDESTARSMSRPLQPPLMHRVCSAVMLWSFSISTLCLCTFGFANI